MNYTIVIGTDPIEKTTDGEEEVLATTGSVPGAQILIALLACMFGLALIRKRA